MDLKELKKLISLTFDSDPKVRKEAALKLADVDDPGAAFALLELSYDKNEEVAKTAQKILEIRGKKEPKLMSFAELFKEGAPSSSQSPSDHYEKILEPINKILEKSMSKERAEKFRGKILPQILKNVNKKEQRKDVMQEVLVAYLEEIGVGEVSSKSSSKQIPKKEPSTEAKQKPEEKKQIKVSSYDYVSDSETTSEESTEIEEISSSVENESLIEKEIEEAKNDNYFKIEYEGEEINFDSSIKPVFQIALSTFLESEDPAIMKKQMENLKKFFSNQIDIAFRVAKEKLKKKKVVHITQIKDGMRRIYTEPLLVVSVKKQIYPRTKKKKDVLLRIGVRDSEGDEGVIYLFDGRGSGITPGMKIRVENGKAKYFSFSGETAIVLTKSGKIVAEF